MEERVFLSDGDVKVTSTRIAIGDQTFATRSVGSVQVAGQAFSMIALLIAVCGMAAYAAGFFAFGVSAVAIGLIWLYPVRGRKTLKLIADGAEVVALETRDAKRVETIRSAIAEAISMRSPYEAPRARLNQAADAG
jgi:hypothetical protein